MMWLKYMVCLFLVIIGNCDGACPKVKEVPKECDFIIVGAGAAGATIASRLSEDPSVSVCLFEAGIKHTEGQFASAVSIPRCWTALAPGDVTCNTSSVPQRGLNGRVHFNGMGKVLGGSTTHNGMAYFRGFKADYDYWSENGAPGWDFDSVLPFFLKSENMTIRELKDSPLHSTCGPLTISQSPITVTSPLWKLWENAYKELKFPIGECNSPAPFGLCIMQSTIKDGKRHSTANAFLDPAVGRRNLYIITEALVGRILISEYPKRAYGIRYQKHGQIYTVKANKEVIVSGGTLDSPKLMQISGIGPKQLLKRLKIRPHVVLPVGERLQNHAAFHIDLDVNIPTVTRKDLNDPKTIGEYLFQSKGLWSEARFPINGFVDLFKQKHNWADIQFNPLDGRLEESVSNDDIKIGRLPQIPQPPYKKEKKGTTIVFFLLHPKSRGTVQPRSTDPNELPLIDPQYLTNREDVKTLLKGIRYIQKILTESPSMKRAMARLRVRSPGFANQQSAEQCFDDEIYDSVAFWECVFRQQVTTGLHVVGTCPIGLRDQKWAVVDPSLRVYGIKGLRVADASVMPEISSGNTMGPTIMHNKRTFSDIMYIIIPELSAT